jgi:hypothetical protein
MSNTRSTTPPKGRPTDPRARQAKPEPPSFKLMGAEYRLADKVGIWPLMQYARAIETGDNDMGQRRMMASAHAILEDSVHPDDWGRFQEDMISKKMDDLLVVLDAVMGAVRIADAKRSRNGRRTPVRAATAEITT